MGHSKNKSRERRNSSKNNGHKKEKSNHRSMDPAVLPQRQLAPFKVHVKMASGMYKLGSLPSRSKSAAFLQRNVEDNKSEKHKKKTVAVMMEQSGEVLNLSTSDVFMANENVEDDMCKLLHVNEPALLHNIQIRSLDDSPYTFVGPVLVAVNPLRNVPEPVNFRKIRRRIRPQGPVSTSHSQSNTTWPAIPHPATIAEYRYQAMVLALSQRRALLHSRRTRWNRDKRDTKVNSDSKNISMTIADQSIVVGGESGSGKTESSRMVLKHLVERCGGDELLHRRLLASSPILEAFGNARTLRNRNSSRFAKFLKLHFDDLGTSICGATVETYLLERSRVTSHETGESNFHIFTLLCSDNTEMNANEFAFLCDANKAPPHTLTITNAKNGKDNSRRSTSAFQTKRGHEKGSNRGENNDNQAYFRRSIGGDVRELTITIDTVRKSLDQFGIIKSTQDDLFEILKGLLHLGNVSFGEEERAAGDVAVVRYEAQKSIVAASEAFGVNKQDLSNALCQRVVRMGSETTVMFRSALSAQFARDALVKAVYVRIFEWLVVKINQAMQDDILVEQQDSGEQEKTDMERKRRLRKAKKNASSITIDSDISVVNAAAFVGVLDIMGIESLLRNDFEQFLINATNTVLQATFIKQVLRAEDELYKSEGLTSLSLDSSSTSPNNKIIDMEKLGGGPTNDKCLLLLQGPSTLGFGLGTPTIRGVDKLTPRGILKVIEDESRMPNSTDKTMLNHLNAMYTGTNAGKAGECFGSVHPRDRDSVFIVIHYAGAVAYRVGNFLLKNHDSLPDELANLIESKSTNSLLKAIWAIGSNNNNNNNNINNSRRHRASTTSGSIRKQTVIGAYVPQLNELVSTLEATACSFIRCIKPNSRMIRGTSSTSVTPLSIDDSQPEDDKDDWFNTEYVMLQLRHLNVTDTTEVLRRGFPTRLSYDTLCELFVPCLPNKVLHVWRSLGGEAPQAFVAALLHAFRISCDDFKLGVNMAFFKTGCLASLTHILQKADTWQQQPGDEAVDGSMSPGSNQVATRFRAFFARRLWRVAFAKIIAQESFRQLLLEVRKNRKQYMLTQNQQASVVQGAWRSCQRRKTREQHEKKKKQEKSRGKPSVFASEDQLELLKPDKDSKHTSNSKHSKNSKHNTDSKDHKDSKHKNDTKRNKDSKDVRHINDSKAYKDLKDHDTNQKSPHRSSGSNDKRKKHNSVIEDTERAISRLVKLTLDEQKNVEHSTSRDSKLSSKRIESSKHESVVLMRRFDQHRRALSKRNSAKSSSNWEKRQQLSREEETRARHARLGHKGPTTVQVAASLVKQAEIDAEVQRLSGESGLESIRSADAKDEIIAWGWKLSTKSQRNWKRRLFVLSKTGRSVSYFTKTKDLYGLKLKGVFSLGDKCTVLPRTRVPLQRKLVKLASGADQLCVAEMIGGRSAKGNGKLNLKIVSMFVAFDSQHTLKGWARAVHISVHGSPPKHLFPRGTFSEEDSHINADHIPETSGPGYAKPTGSIAGNHIPEMTGSRYAGFGLPMSKGSIADLVTRIDELEDQLLDGDIDDATFEKQTQSALRGIRVAEARARAQWKQRGEGGEDRSNFVEVPGSCDVCGEVVFADKSGRGCCDACGSEFELDFILTSRRDLLPTVRTSVRHGHMRMQVNQDAHESGLLLQEIR